MRTRLMLLCSFCAVGSDGGESGVSGGGDECVGGCWDWDGGCWL